MLLLLVLGVLSGCCYRKRLRDLDFFQVDTMDISAGVLVREGKIVRRGPRQVIHKKTSFNGLSRTTFLDSFPSHLFQHVTNLFIYLVLLK